MLPPHLPEERRAELCPSWLPATPRALGEGINLTASLSAGGPRVQRQTSSFLAVTGAGELFAVAVICHLAGFCREVPDLKVKGCS